MIMRIYLAESGGQFTNLEEEDFRGAYILQSFIYANKKTREKILPNCADFMLDSGAFTFMQTRENVDWNEYVKDYCAFIKKHRIKKFFELDIDFIVGHDRVKDLRHRIEDIVGLPPIPVWHNSRGADEFVRMCEEYDYVAIGGLVGGNAEYSRTYWRFFPWFIDTAHKNKARIHGLGFTSTDGIKKYRFDSVDSSTWSCGARYGYIYRFNGEKPQQIKRSGAKIADWRTASRVNFEEWKKYQRYADMKL